MSSSFPLKSTDVRNRHSGNLGSGALGRPHRRNQATPVIVKQASAVVWIAVAWTVGLLVFELTSVGDASSRTWIIPSAPAPAAETLSETSTLNTSSVASVRAEPLVTNLRTPL